MPRTGIDIVHGQMLSDVGLLRHLLAERLPRTLNHPKLVQSHHGVRVDWADRYWGVGMTRRGFFQNLQRLASSPVEAVQYLKVDLLSMRLG